MKMLKHTAPILALAVFGLAGCPGDDTGTTVGTTDDDTTGSTSNGTTPTDTTPTDTTPTADDTSTTNPGTTTDGTTGTGTSTGGDEFQFNETPFDQYTQVDRQGFPAVNSGLNLLGDKDAYNAGSPADDASLMFAGFILESLETLHLGDPANQVANNTGLDDDLMALNLTPCVTPPLPMDTCDDQGGPFAIPDVIEVNLDLPAGFPNGRRLEDRVMDIILAVILLDLSVHGLDTFVDLNQDGTNISLNPLENDVAFNADFPYLADPH